MPDSNQPNDFTFTGTTGTDLSQVTMAEVYRDLITINDSANNNTGVTDGLKFLRDGAGRTLPIQISTTDVSILGDLYANDIHIGNTINLDSIDQYLFNVDTGTTGVVFKLRVGSEDVFSISGEGDVSLTSLNLKEKDETTISTPSEGQVLYNGTDLLCYK
tara:strand:+ start:385 stop:864 length:480 start_codon:yes stop_codon:yes gene_type:complete